MRKANRNSMTESLYPEWAWISVHNEVLWGDMIIIKDLLNESTGNIFVDLGCFIGGFTAPMARKAKERGGIVHSIDLFKDTHEPLDFWREHKLFPAKKIFEYNMREEGVWDAIKLYQGISWELAPQFDNESVDFIWLDADHHYESVIQELINWFPKLKKGGIIGGHDYADIGVDKAVKEYFGENFIVHQSNNVCWSHRKV